MSIVPLNSNAVIFADSTSPFAAKLDSNKFIKGTSVWKNSSAYLKYTRWNSQAFTGCFANNYGWSGTNNSQSQNGYVGLKLVIGNNKYFGWIKLNVYGTFGGNPSGQWGRCIVIDFAYDSTPNHSIHAGATNGARLSTDFLFCYN